MVWSRLRERAWLWGETLMDQHRRQPLLAGTAFFLAGIAFGYRIGVWPAAAVCALASGVSWAWVRSPYMRSASAALLMLQLGWCVAARDFDGRREEARECKTRACRQSFLCRVGPEVRVTALRGKSAKFTFRGEAFRTEDGTFACRHLPAEVSWFGARDAERTAAPQPGEVWRLKGKATVRKGRDGLLKLTVNTGERDSAKLADEDLTSWTARVERARRQAAGRVVTGIEDWGEIPALNQAMLLGNRHAMTPVMRRIFVDSGTIHVFAISGLHIVLVAAVLVLVVSMLGVPRPYWVFFVVPLLVFYTVTTGARPSAVRACLMAALYFLAPLMGRKPSGLAAWTGTALIVYAFQPWLIYDIGCVLSFVVMGGLVIFCRPFCAAGQRLFRLDRFEAEARLLDAGGEKARARRLRGCAKAVKFVSDSFAVSLAAWLASVPLTAYYFGRFTPGGLFANLVIGPCSFFIVVAGCLGMATSYVSAWVASCFNHAAGIFTLVMVKTAELTAACPGCHFRVGKWAPWMVWVWFGGLLLLAGWLYTRRTDGLAWLDDGSGQRG